MSAGEFLGKTVDVVEVAVRLVLVLLVQLILVEALIVKFCRLRNRWYSERSMLSAGRFLGRVREGDCSNLLALLFPGPHYTRSGANDVGGRDRRGRQTWAGPLDIYGLGFFRHRSVQLGPIDAGVVSPYAAKSAGERIVPAASALDGERFAHDGAAPG